MGTFIKASEATLQKRYTSYASICVEMDVSGALHEGLSLEYRDEDYFQAIDYEQIPFRCRKCHEHGHLMRYCPLIRKEVETETTQSHKDKETFIKPKSRQRENRRKNIKGNTDRNNHSNPFVILDLETNSEDKHKTLASDAGQDEKEEPTREGMDEGDLNNEVQMQERTEETEEETDMLTSDGRSEDQEWEEALAREGMNLPVIAENWKARGIENAPEEEIRKVNDLFIARQKEELEKKNRKLGIVKGNSFHSKSLLWKSSSSKQKKRRGRRTSGEVLQELDMILINSGKMKPLSAFQSFQ